MDDLLPRPSVVGVLNVTPDSFSDAGLFLDPDAALLRARSLVRDGAAMVDVGGESTRPGARDVPLDEELRRVVPVLERLEGTPVSIDTSKAEVARRALDLGAISLNRRQIRLERDLKCRGWRSEGVERRADQLLRRAELGEGL
ncbi:MAG: hypothetical protein GEU88_21195, partial [Solirubrobacterales bacterium]|nr:hypothetical protein [Solirubrobacterales bacterium]